MKTIKTYSDYLDTVSVAIKHNDLYFKENRPEISDAEFDAIYAALQQYEATHPNDVSPLSPTQKIGKDNVSGFRKAIHETPMLSLDKVFSIDDVISWYKKLYTRSSLFAYEYDHSVTIEPKYDGDALSLIYIDGKLVQAKTRGDGSVGDDVTLQAMNIPSIPKELPKAYTEGLGMTKVEVRGEVLMPFAAFEEYNRTAAKPAANPRNLASGTLKSYDASLSKTRGLVFVAYTLIHNVRLDFISQVWDAQALNQMGFLTSMPGYDLFAVTDGESHIWSKIKQIESLRSSLPWPIDGVVLKVNRKVTWSSFGATEHHPGYAVAYKFPAQASDGNIKETELLDIEFSLANTGRITPVAITKTVQLYGTNVSRFNIASYKTFMELSPWRKGDTLVVTKGGEIIPKILEHRHDGDGAGISFITKCPSCGGTVTINGAYAYCHNPKCPHQMYTSTQQRKENDEAAMQSMFPQPAACDSSSSLSGYSIVVSGTFSSPARKKELKSMVTRHGGNLQSGVNNKTTHLVAGSGVGPTKEMQARDLGVKIISEAEFLSLIH